MRWQFEAGFVSRNYFKIFNLLILKEFLKLLVVRFHFEKFYTVYQMILVSQNTKHYNLRQYTSYNIIWAIPFKNESFSRGKIGEKSDLGLSYLTNLAY